MTHKPLSVLMDLLAALGIAFSFAEKVQHIATTVLPVLQCVSALFGCAWFAYKFYKVLTKANTHEETD